MNYQEKIKKLVKDYNLSYTFNPGGAEFHISNLEYKKDYNGFINRCQIFTYDDKEDYRILSKWLEGYNE